jgi:hypothetical protein
VDAEPGSYRHRRRAAIDGPEDFARHDVFADPAGSAVTQAIVRSDGEALRDRLHPAGEMACGGAFWPRRRPARLAFLGAP